jgi:serine/threonine-protein kinase PRP4
MFANVVRARILQGEPSDIGREVAIKIIRCQESMLVLLVLNYLLG